MQPKRLNILIISIVGITLLIANCASCAEPITDANQATALIQTETVTRQIEREDYTTLAKLKPQEESVEAAQNDLEEMVEYLNALTFAEDITQDQTDQSKTSDQKQQPAEPQPVPAVDPNIFLNEPNQPGLLDMPEDANEIMFPLELADSLYLAGNLKEALRFYRYTFKKIQRDDPKNLADQTWSMYQIANCLRKSDPKQAAQVYEKLIEQYPNCHWAEPAFMQKMIAEWMMTKRPKEILEANL
jgi:tetratricopeptide (TPR) repeat protein